MSVSGRMVSCMLALVLGLTCSTSQADVAQVQPQQFQELMADRALLDKVRRGGYVLYMRHGTTDNSRADEVDLGDFQDCSRQRVLNDAGRQLAVRVGEFIRQARIPVLSVLHSPLCRARDTARLAFPGHLKSMKQVDALLYTANLTHEQKQPNLKVTRQWLSEPVEGGVNRVVVAHAPNMADLIGYFVRPEGTVVIIEPQSNGQFKYVASFHLHCGPRCWRLDA